MQVCSDASSMHGVWCLREGVTPSGTLLIRISCYMLQPVSFERLEALGISNLFLQPRCLHPPSIPVCLLRTPHQPLYSGDRDYVSPEFFMVDEIWARHVVPPERLRQRGYQKSGPVRAVPPRRPECFGTPAPPAHSGRPRLASACPRALTSALTPPPRCFSGPKRRYGYPVICPCNYSAVITAVITVITAAHSQLHVIRQLRHPLAQPRTVSPHPTFK